MVKAVLELAGFAAIVYAAWLAAPTLGVFVLGICLLAIANAR